MAARPIEQLRQDQNDLLRDLQGTGAPAGVATDAAPATAPALRLAKVVEVVTSDPTYGPHLVVQLQRFSGQPPAPADATAPTRRVYPTPDHAPADYGVNEFVALAIAHNAEFALKLA